MKNKKEIIEINVTSGTQRLQTKEYTWQIKMGAVGPMTVSSRTNTRPTRRGFP